MFRGYRLTYESIWQRRADDEPTPPCSVNIGPDGKLHTNFDPYADKSLTVSVLKEELAEVEAQLTARRPQTDKILTRLAKVKSDLETAIKSFSDTEPSLARTYPRKEKRIFPPNSR